MRNFLQKIFYISPNQCNLVIIYFASFIVQAVALYILTPEKFDVKIFSILLFINVTYNSLYFKMMSN